MLGYLHTFKNISGPHLVVVPKSTLGNWMNEFKRWFPKLRVLKFYGSKEERALIRERDLQYGKFDVVATSYEVVIREKSSLSKFSWEYLIIDEAHRIKNENSTLSQIVRIYNTKCRLLITGTPLQNNLHELWALLNFLLPDVFSDANVFETFTNAVGDEKQEIINQLHKVLKPFILRRLKAEVERGLPRKKELTVYCKMTRSQKVTYQAVLKNNVEVLNARKGERTKLLNIVMQLRKACNHPYLFDGVEDKTLDPFGEHLVEQSGKLTLLDKLLPRLQSQSSRVLIFSQMTRLLDILEDYCAMRSHLYCRIDGQTNGEVRDQMIEDYNAPGSKHFIFLLSTRAGGLGINLTSADIVVLYDSDWNPQMDLQAQDRAHRIGQTKPVKVFRLITESTIGMSQTHPFGGLARWTTHFFSLQPAPMPILTLAAVALHIEEKILDRAMKKLHLDAMVIQSGRLAEKEKNMSKDELMKAIRYGADDVFKADNMDGDDEVDIDAILAKAEEKTEQENKKWEEAKKDGINSRAWTFDGDEEIGTDALSGMGGASGFIDIGKRDRKQITYSENEQAKYSGTVDGPAKQKVHRAKEVTFYDYQFFDQAALRPLLEKERGIVRVQSGAEEKIEFIAKEELTEEEEKKKEELLKAGFAEWGRRDFQAYIRANEKHGRSNIAALAKEIEGKDEPEVRRYAEVFWERGEELSEWAKLVAKIEEGEKRLERQHDINRAIQLKVKRYKNPLFEMKFNYGASKGKAFNEEADRYLVREAQD
jgi:SWI/SNF-related matrix-associated actin-dependent regulator of chromatin subfamily A member 5